MIKRKLHGGLKIWILFSRGKKQYEKKNTATKKIGKVEPQHTN